MEIRLYHKTMIVEVVQVTQESLKEIARWSGGRFDIAKNQIHPTWADDRHRPIAVGDYLIKARIEKSSPAFVIHHYTEKEFKNLKNLTPNDQTEGLEYGRTDFRGNH